MKCVICKNGTCKKGYATKLFEKSGSLIILKHVPAMICDNCGAKYFDSATSTMMLNKVRQLRQNDSEIQVVNIKSLAA
jgi:YgiT-type zinc finger domain-containing protein